MIMRSVNTGDVAKFPRNKVLLAVNKHEKHNKMSILQNVFGLSNQDGEKEQKILKELIWENKYYTILYDLYIDEYEDIASWISELVKEEYNDLREVLAGIIIVDKFHFNLSIYQDQLAKLQSPEFDECFKIWCNVLNDVDQLDTDEANNILLEQRLSWEIIDWNSCNEINEYGEKLGKSRLKELIDIHEWNGCEKIVREQLPRRGLLSDVECDAECGVERDIEPNIGAVLEKLHHARLRFTNHELDNEDAFEVANEIADEILEYI